MIRKRVGCSSKPAQPRGLDECYVDPVARRRDPGSYELVTRNFSVDGGWMILMNGIGSSAI